MGNKGTKGARVIQKLNFSPDIQLTQTFEQSLAIVDACDRTHMNERGKSAVYILY